MPEKSTNGNTVIEKNDEEVFENDEEFFEPLEHSKLGTEEWGEGFSTPKENSRSIDTKPIAPKGRMIGESANDDLSN